MSVTRNIRTTNSKSVGSWPAASATVFGAAVVGSTLTQDAETLAPATAQTCIIGLADKRKFVPKGGYDGRYEQYEPIPVVGGEGMALVTPNGANVNIDFGDFLEVAALGDGSTSAHGILEEAGSNAGTVFTIATVAKALEAVTMGSGKYKVPASDVAVGATSVTMTSGDPITNMGLSVGDFILLEDLSGACQVNKVAAVTATVITLAWPSTVALTVSDSDLVTKLFPCKVQLIK